MAGYITEWVEPSYGCCFMKKADHRAFVNAKGTIEEVFAFRQRLLQPYKSQYPFGGDGKLFDYTDWSSFEETLPRIVTRNKIDQEEQKGKNEIIDVISVQSSDYIESLCGGIPSASKKLKENAVKITSELKTSGSRRKNEGVISGSGNNLKSVSVFLSPEIVECSETINKEFVDSNQKSQSKIVTKIKGTITTVKGKFTTAYNKTKTKLTEYKQRITDFEKQLQARVDALQAVIDKQVALVSAFATQLQNSITAIQKEIINALQNTFNAAIDALTGGLGGLAELISNPLGFTVALISATKLNISTDNANASGCDGDYPNGVPYECDGTRVGKYNGYRAQCFKPKSQDSDADVEAAKADAQRFADQVNGNLWNDCQRKRFVVFWERDGDD